MKDTLEVFLQASFGARSNPIPSFSEIVKDVSTGTPDERMQLKTAAAGIDFTLGVYIPREEDFVLDYRAKDIGPIVDAAKKYYEGSGFIFNPELSNERLGILRFEGTKGRMVVTISESLSEDRVYITTSLTEN